MDERRDDVAGAGGVRLSVRVRAGPGDSPGLLLHHGLASSSHIWDLMLPRLSRTFRVVAYDARGHGLSGKPSSGYGFETTVGDAAAVIRATDLRRPVIVGHSWGALVALTLAARRPRMVSGAVLVDGGVGTLASSMSWAETKENLAPPHLAGMPVDEFRTMIRTFAGDAFEVTPDIEAMVLSLMRVDREGRIRPRLSRANHFRILRAIWELDPLTIWARLRVPILALLARNGEGPEEDGWFQAKRRAARDVRAVSDPTLVRIAWMDGIHDLPVQRPAQLTRRIERFAREVVG
jgi:pimeloyl-ACP methyl ester carboxylesterase